MREFLITVEGKTYEVQVEEIDRTARAAPLPPAPRPAPKVVPIPTVPEPENKPEVRPLAAKAAAGKISIKNPMPGTIVNINVKVGDAVKPDTLLCVLEAMKMENEIFAGVEGVIVSVDTSKGASVNSGDLLFTVD